MKYYQVLLIVLVVLFGMGLCHDNLESDIIRPSVKGTVFHTVMNGETLYDIGKRYNKDWKEIAELNDLDIMEGNIDGRATPIVLIHVGQKILIENSWTEEEIQFYKEETKAIMNRAFIKMAQMRRPPEVKLKFPTLPVNKLSVVEIEDHIRNLRGYYKWRRWVLEMERRQQIVNIIHESTYIWPNPWTDTDPPWIAHRKMCMFMTASIWYESSGFNVVSNMGARNFLQILPTTATLVWGWKWKDKKEEVIEALDTMPTFSVITSIKYWNDMNTQDVRRLSSCYHGGRRRMGDFKPETVVYATKVVNKYRRLMDE